MTVKIPSGENTQYNCIGSGSRGARFESNDLFYVFVLRFDTFKYISVLTLEIKR